MCLVTRGFTAFRGGNDLERAAGLMNDGADGGTDGRTGGWAIGRLVERKFGGAADDDTTERLLLLPRPVARRSGSARPARAG